MKSYFAPDSRNAMRHASKCLQAALLVSIASLGTSLVAREKALSPSPTAQEQKLLQSRQEEFRKTHEGAKILVYPVQIGNATDSESADRIARLVDRLGIGGTATVGPATILPTSAVGHDPDNSVWDLARAFREQLRQNPAAADYALFVSYSFDAQQKAWTVLQYVLCKANGDLVMVEHQDLRWPKYQVLSGTAKSDCDEWIVFWLQRSASRSPDGGIVATSP